jgi:hypothetical protein
MAGWVGLQREMFLVAIGPKAEPEAAFTFFLERSFEPPARRQQVAGRSAGGNESYLN